MPEKTRAQSLAVAGTFNQPGNVGHDEGTIIAVLDDTEVWYQGGKRVVGDLRVRGAEHAEQRGFARVRKSQQANVREEDFGLARQILLEDPGNESAVMMRDAAQAARHQSTDEETRRAYREQWIRTFEELDTMDVPQNQALLYDLNRWAGVSERKRLEFGGGTTTAEAAGRGIDLSGLRARQAGPEDFKRFDLILAMDSSNLKDLQAIRPADATVELSLYLSVLEDAPTDVPDPYYTRDFDGVGHAASGQCGWPLWSRVFRRGRKRERCPKKGTFRELDVEPWIST